MRYRFPLPAKVLALCLLALLEFFTFQFLVWVLEGCVADEKRITLGMVGPVQTFIGWYWLLSLALTAYFSFFEFTGDKKSLLYRGFCTPWSYLIGVFILCSGLQNFYTNSCF